MPKTFTQVRSQIWKQWDRQTNDKQSAYIELNNLYLAIENGKTKLSITNSNTLRTLAGIVYKSDPKFLDYWQGEFEKLPQWFDY